MTVIEFKRPEPPTAAGQARCIDCQHEWTAVVPVTVIDKDGGWFECPSCQMLKGRFKWPYAPAEGQQYWRCKCGNDLYYYTNGKILCPNCGTYYDWPGE